MARSRSSRGTNIMGFRLEQYELDMLSEDEREEYESELELGNNKLTGQTNRLTQSELWEKEKAPFYSFRDRDSYRPDENKLVGGGAWVLVRGIIPVGEEVKPITWGIYWAMACADSKNGDGYDSYGRYKVDVLVRNKETKATQPVSMFPHEYLVVNDELFEELMDSNGYVMQKVSDDPIEKGLNLDLIDKGRALTEDERSIIWSLQVDGLPEYKACEEYFLGRHTENENNHIWYMPTEGYAEWMENMFGRMRDAGVLTQVNHDRRAAARASRAQ